MYVHNMVLGRTLILSDRDIMVLWTLRRHKETLLRDILYHMRPDLGLKVF